MIAIAKFDAGIPCSEKIRSAGPYKEITKGSKWHIPDDYNFKADNAIFEPTKIKEIK